MLSKRYNGHLCCVEGCKTTYGKKEPHVKMYRFPGKPHELELRNLWIKAVNRKNADGYEWQPKLWSRICSNHFLLGKKSNIHDHPSSVPSIFPWTSKITIKKLTAHAKQFERLFERYCQKSDKEVVAERDERNSSPQPESSSEKSKRDVQTQVMMVLSPNDTPEFTFVLSRDDKNNAGVQCKISYHLDSFEKKKTVDAGCDPINPKLLCGGFHGFSSVSSESQLRATTGLSREGFGKLMELFHINLSKSLQNETVLLMFLMKLKLDLSNSVLSVIFQTSSATVKALFVKTVGHLYVKTRNRLRWPEEFVERQKWNVVNEEMPSERQYCLGHRILSFTECKNKMFNKFLIGVSQNGRIIFKSGSYDKSASNGFVTTDSGFLEMIEPQDFVIASAPLELPGAESGRIFPNIVTPPFTELLQNDNRQRILMAVRQSEVCFRKLNVFKALNHLHEPMFQHLNELLHVCCVIANVMPDSSIRSQSCNP